MRIKHILLSVCLLFSVLSVHAQCEIINGSFEEWSEQEFILGDTDGNPVVGDILLPDGTTSFIRFFFIAFAAIFDPSIAELLETEAQELTGIIQSMDASDGDFAVRLQPGYDIEVSDLYSVNSCTEIPETFSLDVKHIGTSTDTLNVFILFDEGLNAIPETEEDLEDVPAYAATEMVFNEDTDYETITLPIIQNFEADIDTFFYLILGTIGEDSYFLIDNVSFDGDPSNDCDFEAAEIAVDPSIPICACSEITPLEILVEYEQEDGISYITAIIDDNGMIEAVDDGNLGFFEDYCPETLNKNVVVISYETNSNPNFEVDNINDLEECVKVSNIVAVTFTIVPILDFTVELDGIPQMEEFNVCFNDDIMESISLSVEGEAINFVILVINEDTETLVAKYNVSQDVVDFSSFEPAEYSMGVVNYVDAFNFDVGQTVDEFSFEGCISISDNIYYMTVLGPEEGCVTNTENVYDGLLSVRPTISEGVFQIFNPENEVFSFTISDVNGATVSKSLSSNINSAVDISHAPNGIYFLTFQIDKKTYRKKIIKM